RANDLNVFLVHLAEHFARGLADFDNPFFFGGQSNQRRFLKDNLLVFVDQDIDRTKIDAELLFKQAHRCGSLNPMVIRLKPASRSSGRSIAYNRDEKVETAYRFSGQNARTGFAVETRLRKFYSRSPSGQMTCCRSLKRCGKTSCIENRKRPRRHRSARA